MCKPREGLTPDFASAPRALHPGYGVRPRTVYVTPQLTPSFFCRLVEEVVYWNTSFLSGNT